MHRVYGCKEIGAKRTSTFKYTVERYVRKSHYLIIYFGFRKLDQLVRNQCKHTDGKRIHNSRTPNIAQAKAKTGCTLLILAKHFEISSIHQYFLGIWRIARIRNVIYRLEI